MPDDAIAHYTELLAQRQWMAEGLCWTVVEPVSAPVTVDIVVRRLGGEPADVAELPWDASFERGGQPVVHLAQVGTAVMMFEVNGYQGAMGNVLERLSQGARAHSAYWNVNALSALSCAAFGHLLVSFEGLFPDQRSGLDIGALDEELAPLYEALRAPELSFEPIIMAVVEQRTGVRLDGSWLDRDQLAIVLPETRAESGVPGSFFDPELEAALHLAPPIAHDAMSGELVRLRVDTGLVANEPEIDDARAALAEGVPRGDDRYSPVKTLTARLTAEFDATTLLGPAPEDPAWRRKHAALAVQHALLPPYTSTPLHALQHARFAFGDDWLAARNCLRFHLRRATHTG